MKKRNLELLGLVENEKLKTLKSQSFQLLNESCDCVDSENDVDVQEFKQKNFKAREDDKELYNLEP